MGEHKKQGCKEDWSELSGMHTVCREELWKLYKQENVIRVVYLEK